MPFPSFSNSSGSSDSSGTSGASGASGNPPNLTSFLYVAFGAGFNLIDDVVTPPTPANPPVAPNFYLLSEPHYLMNSAGVLQKKYPYLYKGGSSLTIEKAKWVFQDDLPDDTQVWVKATTNNQQALNPILADVGIDHRTVTLVNAVFAGTLGTNTDFFDPLSIIFELTIGDPNDPDSYIAAGTSENPVYVCLSTGQPELIPELYQTAVHLACSNSGSNNRDQAVLNTWDLLSARNICKWNWNTMSFSTLLYYYRRYLLVPETTGAQNGTNLAGLFSNIYNSGQCAPWVYLMQRALVINGALPVIVQARPDGYIFFLIKNWTFIPASGVTNWLMKFGTDGYEMMPPPDPADQTLYGDLQCTSGLAGQNSVPAFWPSQKVFSVHQILRYRDSNNVDTYYDPSYGETYNSGVANGVPYSAEDNFQAKVVAGFGTLVPDQPRQLVVQKPTGLAIAFDPTAPPIP